MNRIAVERPDKIIDESHAKAIARNWLTHGEFLKKEQLRVFLQSPQTRKRSGFIRMIDSLENTYGHLVVNRRNSESSSKISGKKARFIELAFLSERLSFSFHKSKILPINVICFDTKNLDFTEFITSFNLSEHLLARIITRSNATSLKDIASWASEFYLDIIGADMRNELPCTDFTLLTHNEIIPFTYMDGIKGRNGLIAKTWIPRNEWTAKTLNKFQPYLDALGDKRAGMILGSTNSDGT